MGIFIGYLTERRRRAAQQGGAEWASIPTS